MARMKSTSKYGQSTGSRANESKGKRKAELKKISKVDKKNFKTLERKDPAKAKSIEQEYKNRSSMAKEDNKGKYI